MKTIWSKFRIRYGLFWTGNKPDIDWSVVIFLVVCYAVAQYVSDVGDRAAQYEKAAEQKVAYEQAVIACLNKKGFYFPDTKKAFMCEAVEI